MSPKLNRNGKPFQLTPEQLALSAERKAKKGSTIITPPSDHSPAGAIVDRAWIALPTAQDANGHQVQQIKVLTWNVCLPFSQQS
jgi:RNA exonuclease NGL2